MYKLKMMEDSRPLVLYNQQSQTQSKTDIGSKSSSGYSVEKEIPTLEIESINDDYEEAMDSIDKLMADEEQAEQYLQLGGE